MQLERPEQGFGFPRQCGPQRGEGVQVPRAASGFVRKSHACSQVAGESADGDSLVDTIIEGVQEQSRLNVTNDLRRFTEVDDHEAVKIGDLENSEAIKVAKPKFEEIFPNAIRVGGGSIDAS